MANAHPVSCRDHLRRHGARFGARVLAFWLTAARARTVAILAHVCSFGLRPAFPPLFLGVAIVTILYLGGGLKPAAFLLF